MIQILPSGTRGRADHGWLDTRHTFSFASYHDPARMGFRALRVLNEDVVAPGAGFGAHPHRDMEIVSYVLSGALAHTDSSGGKGVLRPGEVQRMSAGTGVVHSEMNGSDTEPVHFLQIWILPEARGLPPSHEQRAFPAAERRGRWRLLVARDGREGALGIHQDVDLYGTLLAPGERTQHTLRPGRHAWVQVARGSIIVNGRRLDAGDAAALAAEEKVDVAAETDAEVLLFDLA